MDELLIEMSGHSQRPRGESPDRFLHPSEDTFAPPVPGSDRMRIEAAPQQNAISP